MNDKQIDKIGLAVIRNRQLLMVRSHRNKDVFYVLGGKPDKGENDLDCIEREVEEEISAKVSVGSIRYLASFKEISHDKPDTVVNLKLYFGKILSEPVVANEIAEYKYIDTKSHEKHMSPLTENVLSWLHQNDYID